MATAKGSNLGHLADTRWVLGIVVVALCGLAGGFWGGLMTGGVTNPFNQIGMLAGLFLGGALVITGWIASMRP